MGDRGQLNYNPLAEFLQDLLDGFKVYPKGYAVARCPFHKDKHPSLFIDPQTGRFHCKACRETGGVAKLIAQIKGLSIDEAKELVKALRIRNTKPTKEVEAEYFYTNEYGFLLYKVVRYKTPNGGKTFSFYHYDAESEEWRAGKGDHPDVLYDLPSVVEADMVLVVEGEKCCEALKKYGFVATTNPAGAGNWKEEFSRWLEGKAVYLLPDNDEVGIAHMRKVAFSLQNKASVFWVDLAPYVGAKGDIADFIEEWERKGLSEKEIKERIEKLLAEAKPYDPEMFSLLRKLSLTVENLKEVKTEFLIPDFLPKNALILLTAKYGGGKSLTVLALSKRLIKEGHNVLYIDLDNPIGVVKDRLTQAGLLNALGERLYYIHRSTHPLKGKGGVWGELKKELQTRSHLVVVIDTLKNFASGVELNSDKEVLTIMSELMDIREAGHTVLILHHLPKKVDEESPFKNNTTIVDTVDVAYRLKKDGRKLLLECFKERIPVKERIAFELDEELNLTEALTPKEEEERTIALAIWKLLPPEGRKQSDLVAVVHDHLKMFTNLAVGKARIHEVLNKFEGKIWKVVRAERNSKIYQRAIDDLTTFPDFRPIYNKSENWKTVEPQRFEPSPIESTTGKLNGDNGKSNTDTLTPLKEAEESPEPDDKQRLDPEILELMEEI